MSSGRFAIATHALALLAQSDESCASDALSASINTNPAFLRRILARLSQAGLIEAREGRSGGYRLARPAKKIRLSEVYAAVEPEGAIAPSPCEPNARCPIGSGIQRAFDEVAEAANAGLLRGLAQKTVADIALRAQHLGRPAPAPVKAG
ncbi:Rrf2 family transcriptional regulator [Sorangium sp. So ce327]|jgi:Rrf2 family protein|uniref:Rrf2 family transcriptional regulator n=1 Tax=unclassified Sorangium TaxID=2621164 RepID=UPI003F5C2F3D